MTSARPQLPFLSVVLGIATFSLMDATMKRASIETGVYVALLFRNLIGAVLVLPVWLVAGGRAPSAAALNVHALRALVVALMASLFFWGLVRVPMAEAIALSFIAPLIALYLAAMFLGEIVRPNAILASLLGIAGVAVIAAARFGGGDVSRASLLGMASVVASALLYAVNLVLQRRQAMLAGPIEVALFQNLGVGLILAAAAPWLAAWPGPAAWRDIAAGAGLATLALMLLSWGYARAEAQVLLPIEYTGFLWAALFGWLFFREPVAPTTAAGAALIVVGCSIAARKPTEQTAL
jgi:S-adenosylmethionine uptake transporter